MKFQNIKLLSALLISLLWSLYSVNLAAEDDAIWQDGANQYFKYAELNHSDSGINNHPVNLNQRDITTVLSSLRFPEENRAESGNDPKTVFTASQAELLGQHLTAGLSKAKPNQDVIFALERSVSRLFGLNSDRFFVAGRAFYRDKRLNIIIGDYNRPRDTGFEAAYDPTHLGIVRYNFDHGVRAKPSKAFDMPTVKVNGIENKQVNNKTRKDWLLIDIKAASDTYAMKAEQLKKEQMKKKRQEIIQILDSESEAPSRPSMATDSLEERFATLKRLKEKGLITEEEYSEKKRSLLDEL